MVIFCLPGGANSVESISGLRAHTLGKEKGCLVLPFCLKSKAALLRMLGNLLTLVSLDGSRGSPEPVTSNFCGLAEAFPCLAYPGACGPVLPSQEKSCPPQAAFSQARD